MSVVRGSVLWWLGMRETVTPEPEVVDQAPLLPSGFSLASSSQIPAQFRNYEPPRGVKWTDEQKRRFTAELRRTERILLGASHDSCRQIAREQIERLIRKGKI